MERYRIANGYGIFSLWANWVIGVGTLMFIIFISPIIEKVWLPLLAFTIQLVLYAMVRRNRVSQLPVCYLLPFICSRVLFWSAVVMTIINFFHINDTLFASFIDNGNVNPDIPFISILIVAPITLMVTYWAYKRGHNMSYCLDCIFRNGPAAERGFLGKLFSQEGQYQIRFLLFLSIILTISEWAYYSLFYININLNRPDRFFFVWIPIIFYILSIIYLGMRYFGLWTYYSQNLDGGPYQKASTTVLRYLVISEDHIYLKLPDIDRDDIKAGEEKYDTPARLSLSYRNHFSEYDIERYMTGLSGLTGNNIRHLYDSNNFNAGYNICHYACFIDDKKLVDESRLEGEWFTLSQIERMVADGLVSSILAAEINRIYTISMAWKTYDRYGYRLYNIRNYKPTFRLRDFKDWDVDLNDIQWLYVSKNNEDKPFFRLRRIWRKYINHIGE